MRLALALPLFLLACSSSSSTPAAAQDSGTDSSSSLTTFEMDMDVTVPPSSEIFRCKLVELPTATDGDELFIASTSHEYTPGSHHYLVYRTTLTEIPKGLDQPFDCAGGDDVMNKYATGYVFGGQTPKETRAFPDGIALPMKSKEIVALQAHYINASKNELAAHVQVQMHLAPKAAVKQRAGIYRMYDPYIYVPPKTTATAQMRCPVKKDVTLLMAAPHMHARGMTETVWLDPSPTELSSTPLLVNDDWEHPKEYQGSLAVKAGSLFRFQCAYKNEEDREILQGQSSKDEMCMLSAFYYPAMDAEDEFCFWDADRQGSGSKSCAETTTCIQSCSAADFPRPSPGLTGIDVGKCFQQCIVDSCPTASGPFFQQIKCLQASCATECAGGGDACSSCMLDKCKDQTLACQTGSCGT